MVFECVPQPRQSGVWTSKERQQCEPCIQRGKSNVTAVFLKGRGGNILNWTITRQARWNWTSLIKAGLAFFVLTSKKVWMSSTGDTHRTENSCILKHARTPSGIWHLLSWKWNDFTFSPTTILIRVGPIYFQRIIRLSHRDCFPFLCRARIQSRCWYLC